MKRNIFIKYLVLILSLFFIACAELTKDEDKNLKQTIRNYLEDNYDLNALTEDDKLPVMIKGADVYYDSSNTDVINSSGYITQSFQDEIVVLNVEFTKGEIEDSFKLSVIVLEKVVVEEPTPDKPTDETVIEHVVTFDVDGTLETTIVKDGEKAVKPTDPIKEGYIFIGWYLTDKAYDFETLVTGDITLVAKFEEFIKPTETPEDPETLPAPTEYPLELTEYYITCLDLYGEELLLELRTITTNTHLKKTSYDSLREQLAITDADPNNPGNIILFYSRKSVSAKWDSGNTWNREHVWPQSLGWFKKDGAGCDIHHIRPTNPSINSSRGNDKFANTVISSDYYVPSDDVKGDIARIIFYLKVRYKEADRYPFTTVTDSLDTLLEWNHLDPVDDYEIRRNIEAQKIQGNYNPFIDYPEFAELIWN